MKPLVVIAVLLCAIPAFANVVQPLGAASQVLIPAAGSAAGANGTFFKSDISIINLSNHSQMIASQWLPQVGGGQPIQQTITIPALTGIRSADFVHDYFGVSGLGSIVIHGITSMGATDLTAALFVSSRIWTPQPGTNGTTSQSFPAIPVNTVNTPAAALFSLGSIDNPNNFRVNVGIVNLDPNDAQTFAIQVPSLGPVPPAIMVTIPASSMQQISVGTPSSPGQISIQNVTDAATRSNLWTAYGSTIDNVTGDAWSELAVAGTAPPTP